MFRFCFSAGFRAGGIQALLLSLLVLSGCAGYQIGNESLYRNTIQTIYVPMVKSNSYRRYMGERLTEAVVKQIENNTPYKVVQDSHADAVLNIELVDYTQSIAITDKWGGPRQEGVKMTVKVELVDRRTLEMEANSEIPVRAQDMFVLGNGQLIAAAGQSTSTQQQEAIDRIARTIVGTFEKNW